ncbi:carbohydrate-binding protein [Pontibacter sp. G13]|uniref:carbohydrate-binding protein n=1 Tax=Pontibacter sp. G13 TaxID=3074898 RepID=UPI00288C53DF|nr:carbohydrate-binding protein [Pontibacter sp. G13]WNJ17533.1 carbohydrate-binding protein [Pontibacter sp. G13]
MKSTNLLNGAWKMGWIAVFLCFSMLSALGQDAVSTHGALSVSGNRIVNQNGQSVSFAGASFFWSNWSGQFYTAQNVAYLKSDWNATIVRAAMGVEVSGGYLSNPQAEKNKVKTIVDAAIANGMYVIIDWHTHYAESYTSDAIQFFQEMATTYGSYPNVIYEIYNEPINSSWDNDIKPYAEQVIGAIRAIDPDNLIIVGTPFYSQNVDQASWNPITNYSNIAYTIHFYAATHKASLRAKCVTAMNNGIALMATEWGTCEASGDGFIDQASTNEWMSFLQANGISHCNWSIFDKVESASALVPGASTTGGWGTGQLTTSGNIVRNIVLNWGTPTGGGGGGGGGGGTCSGSGTSLPALIEAENYCDMNGVQTETTTDAGGGQNIGYLDPGDWVRYQVDVPSSGNYTVEFRVASNQSSGQFELKTGSTTLTTESVPNTGGWQNWTTLSKTVSLSAGVQTLELYVVGSAFNVNWINFSSAGNGGGGGGGGGSTPIRIEAEDYTVMSGIQTENCSEGGLNIGYIDAGDWVAYQTTLPQAGSYEVRYRVASLNGGGQISLEQNAGTTFLGTLNVPNTGGWQNWTTISHTVTIGGGVQDFAIGVPAGGYNVNWIELEYLGGANRQPQPIAEIQSQVKLWPNPASDRITLLGFPESMTALAIYNLQGKQVLAQSLSGLQDHAKVDVGQLEPGMYMVRLTGGSSQPVLMKFVKR